MGLAKILFGFDKSDLEEVKTSISMIRSQLDKIKDDFEQLERRIEDCEFKAGSALEVADRAEESVQSIRSELDTLRGEKEALEVRLEELEAAFAAMEDKLRGEQEAPDPGESEALILNLVKSGVDTPGELMEHTGLSKGKLYAILRRLVEKGVLAKRREGRKVHYVIVEEINS